MNNGLYKQTIGLTGGDHMTKNWMALTIIVLLSFFCEMKSFGDNSQIECRPPATSKDSVKIYFAVDARNLMHKKVFDWIQSKPAYRRAIKALGNVITRKNDSNPLYAGFSRSGYKDVEIITTSVFLFTPEKNFSFDINKENDVEYDFESSDKRLIDGYHYEKIASMVPHNATNAVVFFITNNDVAVNKKPVVGQASANCIYMDKVQNIVIFTLKVTANSVNQGGPWQVNNWEQTILHYFSSPEIVSEIVLDYYELSENEKQAFAKVEAIPQKHEILLANLSSIPKKQMWKCDINFNGTISSLQEGADTLAFSSPNYTNELTVTLVSPTGYRYIRKWTGDGFLYENLTAEEKTIVWTALSNINKKPSPQYADADLKNVSSSKDHLDNLIQKIKFKDSLLASAEKINQDYADFLNEIKEVDTLKKKYEALVDRIKVLIEESQKTGIPKTEVQETEITSVSEEINTLKESITILDDNQSIDKKRIEELNKSLLDLENKVKVLEKTQEDKERREKEFARKRAELINSINSMLEKYPDSEYVNTEMLRELLRKVNNLSSMDEPMLDSITEQLKQWIPEKKPEDPQKLLAAFKMEHLRTLNLLKAEHQKYKEDIANFKDLETTIGNVQNATVEDYKSIVTTWAPEYSLDNLRIEINKKYDEYKEKQANLSSNSWKSLEQIHARTQENTNDSNTIRNLRDAFQKWRPEVLITPDERKKIVDECNNWIKEHSDFTEECEELEYLVAQITKCNSREEFEQLVEDAKDFMYNEPDSSSGILGFLFLLLILGGAGYFCFKMFTRKIATLKYKMPESEHELHELSLKQDFSLQMCKCVYDVHIVPVKDENGILKYKMWSPNKNIWYSSMGGEKKELPAYEGEGTYLLYEAKEAMSEFATIELKNLK